MSSVLLFGIGGRMGRLVASELEESNSHSLAGGVERQDHPIIGSGISGATVVPDGSEYPEADVWLDFSLAEPAVAHSRKAASLGKPMVIAATGFTASEIEELSWQAKRCPLLLAPNLSAGVSALESLAIQATKLLPDGFEVGIVEMHHNSKKDSPSGTARKIAGQITEFGGKPEVVSLRLGGAVGEHQIRFVGPDEELILTHRAWSRKAFSSGVAKALEFIVGRPAGLYSLQDIYGLF